MKRDSNEKQGINPSGDNCKPANRGFLIFTQDLLFTLSQFVLPVHSGIRFRREVKYPNLALKV